MFEDRMGEELAWVQLDLDTVSHDVSGNGLIIPMCHQIGVWGIDKLLDKYVRVHQKVYDFTPNQKIMEVMASMMFGCEDNKRINKVLREDNPEYSIFFGLPWWTEQSGVSDTFRALTAENIDQLEMVWQESLRETQVIGDLRRRIEAGMYITIDIDMTGDVCKSKDDPTVTKGYFAQKKGKTGRQKAWAYMTDPQGGIQYLLALEYGSGKMKLHDCLGSLLEKIMVLFDVKGNKHSRLRRRIVIRMDAGGGSPRNMGILDGYGFSYFLKGYSYHVAGQVCDEVSQWHKIPGKDGGFFGISSKTDLPNLNKFCDPIPDITVFGFRQEQEDGKVENAHFITNIPDYMRLSVDDTLIGMWRYYHGRASIESCIKTERNILHTSHKRSRKFYPSWGYLIVAAIAYNLLYLLRDLFFSSTCHVGMKDFVRDAINIPCHMKIRKVRGKPIRQVFLVLDRTNKYAKAFFEKVKEKSIGQLLLPLSRQAQFQQSLFSLRL